MPKHALTLCAQHSHTGTLALTHTHTNTQRREHSLRSPGHTLERTFVGHVKTWVLQQPGAVLPQQLKLEARCQCKQRMRSQRNNLSPSFSLSHYLALSAHCAAEAAAETELKLLKLSRMREKSCCHHHHRLGPPIDFSGHECACNKGALHFDSCQRASDDTFCPETRTEAGKQIEMQNAEGTAK